MQPRFTTSTIIILFLGIFTLLTGSVHAQILTLQQLDLDDAIVQEDDSYSIPNSIVVMPIYRPTADFTVSDRDWFRGLYYFMIGGNNRSGFTDIPFHYVISSDGKVFMGNSGLEERKISVDGIGDSSVVIGYLADRSDTTFDPRADAVVGELLVTIAARHSIKLDKITVSGVEYVRDDQSQTVSLRAKDLFGTWSLSLDRLIQEYKYLYNPGKKQYKLEVVGDVSISPSEVSYGDLVTGEISVRNVGDYGIYAGTVSEIIATKVSGKSRFYDNGTWLSTSQFALMQEDELIRPGQQVDLKFTMNIPLIWGEFTEQFQLGTIEGQLIEGTKFPIDLKIQKPSGTIVQIKPTITGWLRVRATPSGAGREVDRVSSGNRYFQLKNAGNGWIQIKLGDGKSGWVSRQFVKYL